MSTVHSIVEGYSNIERVYSIERDREKTMADTQFQQWCKSMNIGSRVESTNHRANELMAQYTNYTKWAKKI